MSIVKVSSGYDKKALARLQELEGTIRLKGEEIVRLRFEQGCVLNGIVGQAEYGASTVKRISDWSGISEGSLRVAYGMAKHFEFDPKKLEQKIKQIESANIKVTYTGMKLLMRPDDAPQRSTAIQYRSSSRPYVPPKDDTPDTFDFTPARLKRFRTFVDQQPCCISGTRPAYPFQLSKDGDDLGFIPLSPEFRNELHNFDIDGFEQIHNVSLAKAQIGVLRAFIIDELRDEPAEQQTAEEIDDTPRTDRSLRSSRQFTFNDFCAMHSHGYVPSSDPRYARLQWEWKQSIEEQEEVGA